MAKNLDYILNEIPGFLSKREAGFLYDLVHEIGGNVIEIGSLYGRSTTVLAEALKDSGKSGRVYAIDPGYLGGSEALNKFKNNLARYNSTDIVEPIIASSEEANQSWSQPVDVLWIDGDHSYEMAEKDFLLWEPHLKNGGVIAYHDATFNYPGVRKVVSKYIFRSNKFKDVGFIDNIVFATKCEASSITDKAGSMYHLFLKNLVTSSIYLKPPRFVKDMVKPIVRKFSKSGL